MFQVQIAGCPGEVKASSSWYFWCWSNQRIKLHQQRFRLDTGRNFSTEKVIKRLDRAARGSGGVTVEMFKERLAVVWCVRWCSVPAGALTPELSYGRTAPGAPRPASALSASPASHLPVRSAPIGCLRKGGSANEALPCWRRGSGGGCGGNRGCAAPGGAAGA